MTVIGRDDPMPRFLSGRAALVAVLPAIVLPMFAEEKPAAAGSSPTGGARPVGARVPWTTSRVVGSPDPPLPFRAERIWPTLAFKQPLFITAMPGAGRMVVGEQSGKLFSVPVDTTSSKADLLIDLNCGLESVKNHPKAKDVEWFYGLAFHRRFRENRLCYVCYVLRSKSGEMLPDGSRISEFKVRDTVPPTIDPDSERVLLTFLAGGHNGGCLKFDRAGKLLISTGDATGPNPPDSLGTGQDCSDLLSSILRIDVDRKDPGLHYAIPADNPFVNRAGVRPEIWAFGFRNPWRMSVDRANGDLWVGDVGWELWELIHRVERGGNYGWSAFEGRQSVKPEDRRGPTPIIEPLIELPHTIAASITGGYVYRGRKFPELTGKYIFGDWETRRIWAADCRDGKVSGYRDIAEPTVRIVAFGEDDAGEHYLVDYDVGTIHTLARQSASGSATKAFPRRLSETGLFASVKDHQPAAGVRPFRIVAEQWADGALSERWLALPNGSKVRAHPSDAGIPGSMFSRRLEFPSDAVLVRTLSLELEVGKPASRRRVETQLLHFDGKQWRPYTYTWNAEGSDGDLVPADGTETSYLVKDPRVVGGTRRLHWTFASRTQCMVCHNPWAQTTLAFNLMQLKHASPEPPGSAPKARVSELGALFAEGYLERIHEPGKTAPPMDTAFLDSIPALVTPAGSAGDIATRSRSYLHANCGHCHRMGGGGSVDLELHFTADLAKSKVLGVTPVRGTFDLPDAKILAAGDPHRSVLYYRVSKGGRGRMPHIMSEVPDEAGLALLERWILDLPASAPPSGSPPLPSTAPALSSNSPAPPAQARMHTVAAAMKLARRIGRGELTGPERDAAVLRGSEDPSPVIRDLFEPFLPPDKVQVRLGQKVDSEAILKLTGNAARGKAVWNSPTLQCRNCHRIGSDGHAIGPDLNVIGSRRTKAELLESIIEPSKKIEPEFQPAMLSLHDGRTLTGLIVRRNAKSLVLRDTRGIDTEVPLSEIDTNRPQAKSIMPEGQYREMTAQELADLLAYLGSLRP
jgi:putative heme-binding domain-containing protein